MQCLPARSLADAASRSAVKRALSATAAVLLYAASRSARLSNPQLSSTSVPGQSGRRDATVSPRVLVAHFASNRDEGAGRVFAGGSHGEEPFASECSTR